MSKCTFVFVLFGILTAHASAYSQHEQRVTLEMKNVTLREVLLAIEQQTSFMFMYNKEDLDRAGRVSVQVRGNTIDEILAACLKDTGITYAIQDEVIVLKQSPTSPPQQQPLRIVGKVTDEKGESLPGTTVVIKGAKTGTVTDGRGNFILNVTKDTDILVFSFIGMKTQEVSLNGRTELQVVMVEDISGIEEVVITGIFTKPRESNTGSVTSISGDELRAAGIRNPLSSIRNIDPSFNVIQDLEYGSDPNRLPDITMRGRTSMDVNVRDLQEETSTQRTANLPLFILDGFEISLQRVIDMDQELVENITLLKDASATAMYGARGANGVVVITSRRPDPGKLRLSYRGNLNLEAPDFTSYNLMNAREKLEYEAAAGLYSSTIDDTFQSLQELYHRRLTEVERGADTYWLKYPVRTGVGNRHNLTMDGGTDSFLYSIGLGYNSVAGVMKESSRNTFSGSLFFQYELKNMKFQNDLTILYNKNYNSPYGSFSEYAAANPIYVPYDDDGNLKKILAEPYSTTGNTPPQVGNPLFNATLPYRDDGRYTNIQNKFAMEWRINPDLFARGRLGITKQEGRTDKYLSREHTSFATDAYAGENYKLRGSYTYGTSYHFSYEGDITLNFNKTFADRHQLYAGVNFSIAESTDETYSVTGLGFSAINMANLGMAGAYPPDGKPSSSEARSRRVGAILNINYTFDRRYFADFSGKIEGSSKFGANKRTAPFWSAGLGWNLHNESFVENVAAINNLRLRFSYGTTGSQNFSPYQALTTYRYFLTEGYKFWNGSHMIALGNPDLTWQKTGQTNIGLEATLFNRRVSINADFYDKLTESLLADINLPTSAGFQSYKANIGEVRNRGIEVTANVFVLRNFNNFTWSVGGSLVHNQNKILKISNALEFLNDELMASSGANPSFLYKEGESMNTLYVVRSLGIDPATGNEIFLNREGVRTYTWNAEDKVPCGVDEPKIQGNLRTMLRWKNLSLNAIFSYRLGGDVYNQTLVDKVENISASRSGVNNPWNNLDRRVLHDRWQNPGDHAYFKRITDFNTTYASSRFVMKENVLQLNSVNLTYEFDKDWLREKVGFLEYLTASFYAEDVFYLSTIKRERGTTYPFARQFTFSIATRF